MLDIKTEEKQAFKQKNELSAYLVKLAAERDQLLSGNDVLADPIETTRRIAQIDSQLVAGKEVLQKVTALHEDLRRRQEKPKGQGNYIFGIARRGG